MSLFGTRVSKFFKAIDDTEATNRGRSKIHIYTVCMFSLPIHSGHPDVYSVSSSTSTYDLCSYDFHHVLVNSNHSMSYEIRVHKRDNEELIDDRYNSLLFYLQQGT